MKEVLYVAERQREANVEHHRQADDLGACLEVTEREAFANAKRLARCPARLKRSSSDNAVLAETQTPAKNGGIT